MRSMFTFVLLLAVLAVSREGHAAKTEADALIDRGYDLRVKGKPQEALERFQQAHALEPSARTVAQMGLAEADLQKWVESESHLVESLEGHIPWIEKNRKALDGALETVRKHIGIVSVVGPAGTDVTVDGRSIGRLPFPPVHLPEGRIVMAGQAEGRLPASTDVTVSGGVEITLRLEMPLAPSVTTATAPPSHPIVVPPGEQPSVNTRPAVEVPAASSWKSPVGYALVALGAAALTAGIGWSALDGRTSSGHDIYNDGTKGWVSASAGLAAAVGGAWLIYSDRNDDVGSAKVALFVAPTGMAFGGTF